MVAEVHLFLPCHFCTHTVGETDYPQVHGQLGEVIKLHWERRTTIHIRLCKNAHVQNAAKSNRSETINADNRHLAKHQKVNFFLKKQFYL